MICQGFTTFLLPMLPRWLIGILICKLGDCHASSHHYFSASISRQEALQIYSLFLGRVNRLLGGGASPPGALAAGIYAIVYYLVIRGRLARIAPRLSRR